MTRTLCKIGELAPGEYFTVKSSTYGEIAFKKNDEDEPSHTRLHDAVFYDPTFGDETIVRRIDKGQVAEVVLANRLALGT